jgi:predicted O-methyltransferase YrrM|tara:strand:- start:679 stop:1302 length:624 start_codon:yes stop_codon:yes gene_type:complete
MKQTYFNIPGWFNYSETYDVIVDRIDPNGKILEIGSFLGRSTHYLATSLYNANKLDVTIYCVDTFEGSSEHANIKLPKNFYNIFRDNLKFFIGRDMVIPIQGRSDNPDILNKFEDEEIDFIMIDGAHEYDAVKDDIINWYPKLKSNGVMFGDDYSLKSVEVAVKEGLGECKHRKYGVNQGYEQTWYCSKDGENQQFEKQIPGVNIYV